MSNDLKRRVDKSTPPEPELDEGVPMGATSESLGINMAYYPMSLTYIPPMLYVDYLIETVSHLKPDDFLKLHSAMYDMLKDRPGLFQRMAEQAGKEIIAGNVLTWDQVVEALDDDGDNGPPGEHIGNM